jgi:hypothetical protein
VVSRRRKHELTHNSFCLLDFWILLLLPAEGCMPAGHIAVVLICRRVPGV